MALWISILLGAALAWFAVKLRFYETWALLFNIVISVYLAVFLGSQIAAMDLFRDNIYGLIIGIGGVGAAVFAILHSVSYALITGQYSITYPKIIDVVCAAVLGFLAGHLVGSFLVLSACITPLSQGSLGKKIGLYADSATPKTSSLMLWWCDKVDGMVSSADDTQRTQEIVSTIFKDIDERIERRNEARRPKPKPVIVPVEVPEEDPLGPPPESDIKDY